MINQIEALETALNFNEDGLANITKELKKNPFDRRAAAIKTEALNLLEDIIAEAEFVHKDQRVANLGKEQYNRYGPTAKYQITPVSDTKSNGNNLERAILLVDDQWGRADDPMIPERYGNGKVPGYSFKLEDALKGESYDSSIVIERLKSEKVDGILLDMDFNTQRGYGEKILEALKEHHPKLPVFIFSSTEDKNLITRCLEKGAVGRIPKAPSAKDMKKYLDDYFLA
ncbi:MAG: response regulator [archaeon]